MLIVNAGCRQTRPTLNFDLVFWQLANTAAHSAHGYREKTKRHKTNESGERCNEEDTQSEASVLFWWNDSTTRSAMPNTKAEQRSHESDTKYEVKMKINLIMCHNKWTCDFKDVAHWWCTSWVADIAILWCANLCVHVVSNPCHASAR